MRSVEVVLGLVLLATVVAALASRLSAPAPSLLVLAGLAVASVPGLPDVRLSPDVVGLVVLPPLLYAAGQDLSVRDLRTVWRPVGVLAVGLVVATATAVAALATVLLDLPAAVGFVLGAVLASTDPVAVTALARALRLPPRLETLVSAESLFNDATSLVLFRVAVGVVVAGTGVPWGGAALQLLVLGGGGAAVGLAVAVAVAAVRRRTHDPVLETVIALVTPYASYVAAETVHTSGVTSVVVTGVAVGWLGTRLTSARNRLQLAAVTGTVVFLLESVVFSLIGLQLPGLVHDLDRPVLQWLLPALAVTATVVVLRALWVFPLAAVLGARSWRAPAVITWAGTRGVVPLAAALSIPLTVDDGSPFPERNLLLVLAIGVSVATLVGQGLTLKPLTLRSGIAEGPEREQREQAHAQHVLAQAALDRAQELLDAEAAPPHVLARLVEELTARRDRARDQLQEQPEAHEATYRALRRDVLRAESARLARLLADGEVGEATWRRLQRGLDLEDTTLGADQP